ncbi:DUF427 domain-containing protein [Halomonas llamarensis]|uniref:DUF427 domain-containing protein n=1 Tax=Halomonas llamarensis TaxID=2945104 RepID=A0ABT0SVL6_9GAMM|nr:DUF427 domain-containing protein [Halomonas llamarensis]MCL7931339.1 DUF427 domain-containing protein [Halomonas llamarensis]
MQDAKRITLHPTNQCMQVHVDGTLLVEVVKSTNALELRERGYPPRHYFPRDDVRMDLMTLSETTTHCTFKGNTAYYSLGDKKDIAWSYEQPVEGMGAITSRVAFGGEENE